ncbi:MFS transporter [Actinocorallia lasiicapitis]
MSAKVLSSRPLRRFMVGQAAAFVGDGLLGIALAFAVLDLGGSPAELGFVLAAHAVAMVGFLLFGGVLADRLPRRNIMVVSDLTRFAAQLGIAVLVISGTGEIWQLAALNAVHGLASGAFAPAAVGLMPSIVPPDGLQQANAVKGLTYSLGNIAGPALAGLLVAGFGPGWAIAGASSTFLVSAVLLLGVPATAAQAETSGTFLRDLLRGWQEFRSRTWVWATVVYASLANLLLAAFLVLGPVIADRDLGGPSRWAAVMGALGVGSLVGGVIAFRVRPRHPLRAGIALVSLCALPALALAGHRPVVAVAGVAFLAGLGLTVFNTLWETSLQTHVPAASLSRVGAYDAFGSLACQPLGQAVVGPVAVGIGLHPTLWLAGGLQLAISALAFCVPALRALPAAEDDAVDLAAV